MSNFPHVAESKPEAFMEKSVGVALPGYEWVQALGLLMHCCDNQDLAQELFEDVDTYNSMVMVVKRIQRQVLGVQDLLASQEAPKLDLEVASHKKIILM